MFLVSVSACSLLFADPKKTEEYQCGIEIVRKSEEVRRLLGAPLNEGASATGPISKEPSEQAVGLIMPISGPKGVGKLYLTAVRDRNSSDLTMSLEYDGELFPLYAGPYPCS